MRNPLIVAFSVWQAIFLREALERLFDVRMAWFWLLLEPLLHIGFISFMFTVVRMRTVDNADVVLWIIIGMLSFFLFRRTAVQVNHAPSSNRHFFAYRQVQPFDPSIARAVLEAFLMSIISALILTAAYLFGHETLPQNPLLIFRVILGLWLLGIGYGLIASVIMALVPEAKHILRLLMMPLYLISGVIFPLSIVPQPYLDWLMYNPLAHAIELTRVGYFPYYHALPNLSLGYVYAWAITSLFLGLALYRRFHYQLIMK